MTAREMFKKLGFEQTLNDSDFIFYEKVEAESCHTRFMFALESRSFEAIFYVDGYGGGGYFIELDEFKVILKQMEELGWIEEKPETNYEHFKDEIVQKVKYNLAVVNGEPKPCEDTNCDECDFKCSCCGEKRFEWLASPYKKTACKLTKFEYDLLNAHKDSGMQKCLSSYRPLLELNEKGYFKDIDTSVPIYKILENCEVKDEKC